MKREEQKQAAAAPPLPPMGLHARCEGGWADDEGQAVPGPGVRGEVARLG